MEVKKMVQVIGKMRYNTATARLIASDEYWDGNNWERHGTNTFLFTTKNGNYFEQFLTMWIGGVDRLIPLTKEEAISEFERLISKEVDFEEAFPGVTVEEA